MKKYIILFLLWGVFGNAQYNLFARQNFAKSVSAPTYNTYIGGVSGTISTPALLATKLGIDVSKISNFTIVGSDIKCKITGIYGIPAYAFNYLSGTPCTYYVDSDNLVNFISDEAFYLTSVGGDANFKNAVTAQKDALRRTAFSNFFLDNCVSIGANCFETAATNYVKTFYIPNCTDLGGTVGNNSVFVGISSAAKIYCHPSLATNNGGLPDGDLTYAITQGATVRYVTNFTAPNPVTTLAAGTVYNTAIQLNFTPPSSTNAIDYYDCYANGIYKNRITGSGQYITGLSPSNSYTIEVKPVDIFYNKSTSNILSQTTTNSLADTDATAYVTASSNTAYQYIIQDMFKMLKDNSLYAKIQAFYPFLGTTASQHKWNAKNPVDTDDAFRLTFNGTASFSNLGYQLNGSSYANTHFVPSTQQTLNSNGMTVVCGTNNAAFSSNVVDVGAYNGAAQASYLMVKNNNTNYKRRTALNSETAECSQSGINESRGIFTGTKQSSTVTDLFVNGSQVATSNQSSGTLPTLNMYIGALNFSNSAITNSNQRLQMVIFHEGLSDVEVSTLYTVIDTFENALGRKTW